MKYKKLELDNNAGYNEIIASKDLTLIKNLSSRIEGLIDYTSDNIINYIENFYKKTHSKNIEN